MALSRLRHPVISRYAPSLFKVRFVSSSSGSLARCLGPQTLLVGCDDSSSKPALFSSVTGVQDASLKLKLRIGVRHFSSSEAPAHEVLEMPALSPTMTQGNITKWKKKEGDAIAPGDVLCEIETDKATIEFESLEEGFLAKILVPDGSKDVPVGQPICITVEDADDIQNVPAPIGNKPEAKEEKPTDKAVNSSNETQGASSIKIDASALPPHIVVDMPALSPTMNQGNIAKWIKKEGDKIDVGDVICEIETDKATLEFECLEEGYLAKILAPEGTKDVAVGQPIAITVEDPNDIEAVKTSVGSDHGKEVKEHQTIPQESKHEFTEQTSNFTKISPSAKLLIAEHGLDISSLNASGPYGTLLKSDVVAAIKSGKGAPKQTSAKKPSPGLAQPSTSGSPVSLQQEDSFEDTPNTQIRKIIARRLLESKQSIPHLYLSTDVILDSLLSFRKELKDKHDIKVSVNDIVIKAVAVALRNVPEANAYWNSEKGEIILCDSVDISIAVATEKGLMTPIVKNADQKSITSISTEVKQLAEKARAGKLAPHEFQGGTFSISNLGMYPVDQFSAIINPPQSGILAVGRGNKVVEPVIGADGIERAAVLNKMILTLSADHRVFDGKVGGDFLAAVRSNFSDIKRLLL